MTADRGLKLSVAGKGGVGKTTVSAGLALALADRGETVLAVDGDSNNCLGYALGFPPDQLTSLRPLAEMRKELEERAQPGLPGAYLLAPPVADLIDKYSVIGGNLRLLVMGTIGEAGSGCACPLNAALRQVLRELVKRPEAMLVDMEAGIEHLGRGTAAALDTMLLVAEPAGPSLRTCARIARLAGELGVTRVAVVANKVRGEEDIEIVRGGIGDLPLAGSVPRLDDLREPLGDASPSADRLMTSMSGILDYLAGM